MNPIFSNFIAANHLALEAGCAAGVGACLFFLAVRLFKSKNSSGPLAKTTAAAARPGIAAIAGKATGARTLAAPISGKPCFVYRASVWQQELAGKNDWKNVAEETGYLTFLIEDGTGQLPVEPGGAELDLRRSAREVYGVRSVASRGGSVLPALSNRGTVTGAVSNFLDRNGISLDRPVRIEEYCLEPATPVLVTGTVVSHAATPADALASSGGPAIATNSVSGPQRQLEVIRLDRGAVTQSVTQMSQQAKIAAALAKAGLAERNVWASSTSAPTSSSNSETIAERAPTPAGAARLTVTKGSGDSTFIISNRLPAEREIFIGWKSVALVLAGSTLTTLGLYALLFARLR